MNRKISKLIKKFVTHIYKNEGSDEIRKMYQLNKKLWNETPRNKRNITRKFMENPEGFMKELYKVKK